MSVHPDTTAAVGITVCFLFPVFVKAYYRSPWWPFFLIKWTPLLSLINHGGSAARAPRCKCIWRPKNPVPGPGDVTYRIRTVPASRSVGHGACRADSPAGERMDSPAAGRGPDSAAVFEAVEYGRISNLLFHPRYRSLDRRPSRDRHRHTRAVSRNAVRYKSLVRGEKGPRVVAANAATAEGGGRDKDGAAAARASRFRRHSRRRQAHLLAGRSARA